MPEATKTETAPVAPPAGTPAKPEAPAQRKIELFTRPDAPKPAAEEPKPAETPPAEAAPAATDAEVVPATEAEAAKKDEAPAPPKPTRRASNLGAEKAKLAKERNEVAAKQAAAEEAAKQATEEKAKLEKEVAEFKRREAIAKEDPRALLDLYNLTLEQVNKAALSGAPMDPRVLELKARQVELEKKLEDQKAEIAKKEQERAAEQVRMQEQFYIEKTKGQIEGALKDDAYELARVAGWTPEEVWEGMRQAFAATGKLPTVQAALEAIEADEKDRFERVSKAKKVQAVAPKPAPAPAAPAPKPTTPTLTNASAGPTPKKPTREGDRLSRLLEYAQRNPIFSK